MNENTLKQAKELDEKLKKINRNLSMLNGEFGTLRSIQVYNGLNNTVDLLKEDFDEVINFMILKVTIKKNIIEAKIKSL